MLPEQRKL